jgi:hypothetical protein
MKARKRGPWARRTSLALGLALVCAAPAAAIDISGDYATLLPSNLGACVLTLTQNSNLTASGCDFFDTTATVDPGTGAFTVSGSFGSTECGPGTGLSGSADSVRRSRAETMARRESS